MAATRVTRHAVKGALFDLDGTLLDTEPIYAAAAQAVIDAHGDGRPYGWPLRRKVVGAPELTGAKLICDEHRIRLTPEEYLVERNKHLWGPFGECSCLPGAERLLATLHDTLGLRVALATSSWRPMFEQKMLRHNWLGRTVDVAVTGDDPRVIGRGKPEPDIFVAAAADLGLVPSECVIFEDAVNGVIAAKRAGAALVVAVPDPHFRDAVEAVGDDVLVLNSLEDFDVSVLQPSVTQQQQQRQQQTQRRFGGQSATAQLRRAIIKPVAASFVDDAKVDSEWESLRFTARPSIAAAAHEQAEFIRLLHDFGGIEEVLELPAAPETTLDSLYTYDPLIMTNAGAVLMHMGKPQRRTEPQAFKDFLRAQSVPVLGEIAQPGTLEGGDAMWLDSRTMAVGLGFRSNAEGVRQLRSLLEKELDAKVVEVQLPYWHGPDELLHLLSCISPLDQDLAVVERSLMPVCFVQHLEQVRGMTLVDVADATEFAHMACNVLATSPRRCIMLEGNPLTQHKLEAAGCTVATFAGNDLCHKGCGGPTCMTQPLLRRC